MKSREQKLFRLSKPLTLIAFVDKEEKWIIVHILLVIAIQANFYL